MKSSTSYIVMFFTVVSLATCKPRKSSKLSNTSASDVQIDLKTVSENIVAINRLVDLHTIGQKPLAPAATSANNKTNSMPIPSDCAKKELWKSDVQWMHESIVELERFAKTADIRVQAAAITGIANLSIKSSLSCASEHTAELFQNFVQGVNAGRPNCSTYSSCAVVLSLTGNLLSLVPEQQRFQSTILTLQEQIKSLSDVGINSRNILRYKVAAYSWMADFYRASQLQDSKLDGIPRVISGADHKRLTNSFKVLEKQALDDLFVVGQMRDTLNINPALVKQLIQEDMLAGIAFKDLKKDVQDFILEEALGLFDSAWQLQQLVQAYAMYSDRLSAADPRAWLAKIEKAAKGWSQAADSFDDFALSDSSEGSDWGASVNPKVAMIALTQFVDKESKLPWRRVWADTTSKVFETVPTAARDFNLAANYTRAINAPKSHRAGLLKSLESQGLTQNTKDVSISEKTRLEVTAQNEKTKNILQSLLDQEEGLADYFPGFTSVYDEFVKFYELSGKRMMHLSHVIEKLKNSSPTKEERELMISNMDQASISVLDQWLQISCVDAIFKASRTRSDSAVIQGKFPLDKQIDYKFDCLSKNSGDKPQDLSNLHSRIVQYSSTISYNKGVERGLVEVKEAFAKGALLVVMMPLGFGGKLTTMGLEFLFARAATSAFSYLVEQAIVRSVITGTVNLVTNYYMFEGLVGLNDRFMDFALGIKPAEKPEQTWGQYIYHTGTGMATFAMLGGIQRFSGTLVGRFAGSAGSRELSTVIQAKATALAPSWKRQTAEFLVGGATETAFFFAMPTATEMVGTHVLGIFESVSPDQKAMQKLYLPSMSESFKDAFTTALLFRMFGLVHGRGHLPETIESVRYKESTRASLNESMSKEQALTILGATMESQPSSLAKLYRTLSLKYHPDRAQSEVESTLASFGGTVTTSEVKGQIFAGAANGLSFEQVAKAVNFPQDKRQIFLPIYNRLQQSSFMMKQINEAKNVLKF